MLSTAEEANRKTNRDEIITFAVGGSNENNPSQNQ